MLVSSKNADAAAHRSKFEAIYLEYRDIMYAVAYDVLHNAHDAEDAVHSAFEKIAENIHKIGEVNCPKTQGYIVTIAENKAIDIYRQKKARPAVQYNEETVGIHVEYHGSNGLADCILKLPVRQRQTIILKYHYGYALKEIAKMLEISYANALKIEQRAKAKLKILCQEAGIEW